MEKKFPIPYLLFFAAEVKKQVPSVEEDEVLRPLLKCYTSLEVSSNKGDVSRCNKTIIVLLFIIMFVV